MLKQADRPAARIKIWGNHSLQTYIDSDMYHEEIETSVTDSSYLLLRPEKLFSKTALPHRRRLSNHTFQKPEGIHFAV